MNSLYTFVSKISLADARHCDIRPICFSEVSDCHEKDLHKPPPASVSHEFPAEALWKRFPTTGILSAAFVALDDGIHSKSLGR
jgi:hypothetical protein